MQLIGTDIMRNITFGDIWCQTAFNQIKINNYDINIITDIRLPSEMEFLIILKIIIY